MAKRINKKHKNFLNALQNLMEKRYIGNDSENYSEQDQRYESIITGTPVNPINSHYKKPLKKKTVENTNLSKFDLEYLAFINQLKAKKQQAAESEDNVNQTNDQ